MWEIIIQNRYSGENDTVFGYNFVDACIRNKYNPEDFIFVGQWYID